MGKEIERKFLVSGDGWRDSERTRLIRQGFFLSVKDRAVRVRIMGTKAFLTMKTETRGFTRAEFEYEIPISDAEEILNDICEKPLIEKTRHWLTFAGKEWVIDEFHGDNDGLILAEIELDDEMEKVERPDWAGMEVSDNPRYYNVYLAKHPFNTWNLNPKCGPGQEKGNNPPASD
ncbi:CYTH domain-containing protein [Magnetococcales bacterium HHB-1]